MLPTRFVVGHLYEQYQYHKRLSTLLASRSATDSMNATLEAATRIGVLPQLLDRIAEK